jgi:gamma-glutamylcyclotransferase (GGCT)/AIG2-like uncharacterized protein YtfP
MMMTPNEFTGLYFAYGSNLHVEQMSRRCPLAVSLGRMRLPGWRLIFRGVADIVPDESTVCYGGVWRITRRCEAALDQYEGVAGGMYRKEYIALETTPDGIEEMLVYTMNSTGVMPPSERYLGIIEQGYRDFAMPKRAWRGLDRAVRESWDDKAPSYIERQRRRRDGRPTLAERPAGIAA